jgi:hypothetical protein
LSRSHCAEVETVRSPAHFPDYLRLIAGDWQRALAAFPYRAGPQCRRIVPRAFDLITQMLATLSRRGIQLTTAGIDPAFRKLKADSLRIVLRYNAHSSDSDATE